MNAAEVAAAQPYDGIAPGAKIYFTDVMYNADPGCNIPEDVCDRVDKMTVPVDVAEGLFPAPYAAGARVHQPLVNSSFAQSFDWIFALGTS